MTLRGATFVDGCDLIWKCRTIKSAAEVEVFGNEDYVVVTKDGCDRFPSFRKDIRSLPFEG